MTSMSPINTAVGASGASSSGGSASPQQTATPKNVAFELLFLDSPQYRARLPMRVQIYPHDTTDSIVTTVKNFYGLYSGPTGSKGVSFEDEHGNTLIARYENFRNNMVVYVRVIEEPPANPAAFVPHPFHPGPVSVPGFYAGDGYPGHQPQRFAQDISRPSSRSSRRRSPSPNTARGRRSVSASTSSKHARSRSAKNRVSAARSHADNYSDSMNGYSSGDGAGSSTSGKNKEQLGNTDISVENIVEGGRRKRAKFESSVSGDSLETHIWRDTNCVLATGIAPVCAAPDAGSYLESVCLTRSSSRTSPTCDAICAAGAKSLHEPPAYAIAAGI